jgi:hypothetical protein
MSNPKLQLGSDDTYHLQRIIGNDRVDFTVGVTSSKTALTILDTGYIGIGTNAPVNKVTIRQDQADFTTLEIRNNNTTSNTAGSEILFGSYRDIETTTFEGSKIRAINVDSGSSLFQYQDLAFYTNNAFLSGASERMRITKDGDVGIGTDAPSSRLHVHNSGGAGQIQLTSSTSGTATSDGLIIEMSGSDDVLFLNKENTNMIFYTNNTEQVRIDSSGNVGIGTNAPAQQVHIYNLGATGSYNFTAGEGMVIEDGDANLQLKSNNVGSYGSGLLLTTAASTWGFASTTTALSNKLYIGHRTSASDEGIQGLMSKLVTIETSGDVGIGTDAPSSRLHVHNSGGAGQIQLTSSTSGTATSDGLIIEMSGSDDTLFLNKENTNMIFYTNNTEQVRIDSSGNVGIGTNAPGAKLEVNGGAYINGNLRTAVTTLTTGTHSLDGTHSIIKADTSGGNITINLPAVSGYTGAEYKIIKTNASNTVTIDANASELIDGTTTNVTLTALRDRILIVCDGAEWHTF